LGKDVRTVPHPNDETSIANHLYSVLNEYQITNKVICVTTDNAAKMLAATKTLHNFLIRSGRSSIYLRIGCAAHILNLVIKNARRM